MTANTATRPIRPQALKLPDAARYLGLSQKTVRRLVERGELRRVSSVRHLLFAVRTLDAFLLQN